MDPVRNPYAPGAGNPPPELAGRLGLLDDIEIALRRIALGRPAQSVILTGLRGVGKTVLLVRIGAIAEELGYRTLTMEAHDGRHLADLLVPGLRAALLQFSATAKAADAARSGLRVLKSFLHGLSLKVNDIELALTLDPETGAADSGALENDLPALLVAVAKAARAADRPMALLLDELQYLSAAEFSALIMAMHRVSQLNLPLLFAGAGLPQLPALVGESKTYAERMFQFPAIGALSPEDARIAIAKPAEAEGASVDPDALDEIIRLTEGYPYFIQQWSHDAWNIATDPRITRQDVLNATPTTFRILDRDFFRVRFERCNAYERRYLRALADLGPGPHRSGAVARHLGVKTTSLAPARDKLIRKGMIYAPQYGDIAFTVPLFDTYMKRAVPADPL
jgi:hypothetical protein